MENNNSITIKRNTLRLLIATVVLFFVSFTIPAFTGVTERAQGTFEIGWPAPFFSMHIRGEVGSTISSSFTLGSFVGGLLFWFLVVWTIDKIYLYVKSRRHEASLLHAEG